MRTPAAALALACALAVSAHPSGAAPAPHPAAPLTAQEVGALIEGRDIFYDADGLIVHRGADGNDDGGDTAQREGWYWLGVWLRQNVLNRPWPRPRRLTFAQVVDLLEPHKDGVFYRHPKLAPWNNPRSKEFGFSRDQMLPLVAAMGVWGMKAELRRLWDALPEDILGKHTFNGNFRNFLGQDGWDCQAIKDHGCDATADCSLRVDTRDCSLKTDDRDCSLKTDDRDCSLKVDTRDCSLAADTRDCEPHWNCRSCDGWDSVNPACHAERAACEVDKGRYRVQCEGEKAAQNAAYKAQHDACELEKATQNAGYKAEHDTCEIAKAGQNAAYKAEHDACEVSKAGQNAAYKVEHDACEAGKAAQNLAYKAEHDLCEVAKAGGKAACEAQKALDQAACMLTNVHSGDLVGPAAVNLFRRAMDESPLVPLSAQLPLPPLYVGSGPFGEAELAANVGIRMAAGGRDRDDTGDDLNLIVMLAMAKLRHGTPVSQGATTAYRQRPLSFGSFLGAYGQAYGDDPTDMTVRIADGIRAGWAPDASGPYGAVRWYHRPWTGANPQLAELYREIIDDWLR